MKREFVIFVVALFSMAVVADQSLSCRDAKMTTLNFSERGGKGKTDFSYGEILKVADLTKQGLDLSTFSSPEYGLKLIGIHDVEETNHVTYTHGGPVPSRRITFFAKLQLTRHDNEPIADKIALGGDLIDKIDTKVACERIINE